MKFNRKEDVKSKPYIGMVRHLDMLKRLTIPAEYMEILNLSKGISIHMFLDGEVIKFRKLHKD